MVVFIGAFDAKFEYLSLNVPKLMSWMEFNVNAYSQLQM
jgi:hypothetical protein